MATTDLSSRSLGDILLESGNGSPDHSSPKGSLYVDKETNTLYINTTGTTWQNFSVVSYGEGYYVGNSTSTTFGASNTWVAVANNFTAGNNSNFTVSGATLVLNSGCDGLYNIDGSVTINWVAGTPNYEVGVSVNNATPVSGSFNGDTINTTYRTANISFSIQANLVGGNDIRLAVRNLTDTSAVIIQHAQLTAYRVK